MVPVWDEDGLCVRSEDGPCEWDMNMVVPVWEILAMTSLRFFVLLTCERHHTVSVRTYCPKVGLTD